MSSAPKPGESGSLRELAAHENEAEARSLIFAYFGVLVMCAAAWSLIAALGWFRAQGALPELPPQLERLLRLARDRMPLDPAKGIEELRRAGERAFK